MVQAGTAQGGSPRSDVVPGTLGRYEILMPLARGGMATVYLARARGLAGFERVVAVKCCHDHLAGDPEFVSRFLDEARLAARIHHPNVVPTLDVGDDPKLYLVMEYVDGERLFGLVRDAADRDATLPAPIALRIMVDALRGLHAAHELRGPDGASLNLVHRDVSPQNIMVGVDGIGRIMDFGIAKADARLTVTRDDQARGKLAYMAPEQLLGTAVTRRADVYTAGVVAWEALTARRLFTGDTPGDMAAAALRGTVPLASLHADGVTARVDAVLARAMARDPTARFATAADFADALEDTDVRLADARAVGAYVERVMAVTLATRRAALGQAIEQRPVRADPSPTDAADPVAGGTLHRAEGPRSSTRARVAMGLGALALIASAAVVVPRMHSPREAPRTVAVSIARPAPAPQPVPAVPASAPVFVPPAAPVAVAPPPPRAHRSHASHARRATGRFVPGGI